MNKKKWLKYYFLVEKISEIKDISIFLKAALKKGVTCIGLDGLLFKNSDFSRILKLRNLCKCNNIPFIVHNNLLLGKSVESDGFFFDGSENPEVLREILGEKAFIGTKIEDIELFDNKELSLIFDFIGFFGDLKKRKLPDNPGRKKNLPLIFFSDFFDKDVNQILSIGFSGVCVNSFFDEFKKPGKKEEFQLPWSDEFFLINRILGKFRDDKMWSSVIKIPPGDDASLLKKIENPVITTDTQREGVHFRFDWQTPEEVGYKAVSVTLSDLAASFAKPVSLFINLTLPKSISEETAERVYDGVFDGLKYYNCSLGGGNISGGDQFSLDLFAIGESFDGFYPERSNGVPGENLYSTGFLGLARAGLNSLQKKKSDSRFLIDKFKRPVARFDAAKILFGNGVQCVLDISDGLAGDTLHMAKASNLSVEFEITDEVIHPELIKYCDENKLDPVEMIISGGEEYELLFTCNNKQYEKIVSSLPDVIKVGRCVSYNGKYLLNIPEKAASFQHGGKTGER